VDIKKLKRLAGDFKLFPFFFEWQRRINCFNLDFSCVCGMVDKVEKSNILMLLQNIEI
jgi:hypothetical protein